MRRKFVKAHESEYKIEGALTIRGVTHSAIFYTKLLTNPAGIMGNQPFFSTASTFVKRKECRMETEGWPHARAALTMEILKIRLKVKCNPEKRHPSLPGEVMES